MILRLKIISLYLVAFLLLIWVYKVFVFAVYGYIGFQWQPKLDKIVESFIFVGLISAILPVKFKKPSDILLNLHFFFPVLPMLVLYGVENEPRGYLYVTILSFLIIYFLVIIMRLKPIRAGSALSPVLYQKLLLLTGWVVIGFIVLLGGWRYFNLNIWKVYEFRSAAADNLPHIFGYINPLISKVVFPFSLLIAVINREKLLALLSMAGSIVMFGLTSHKGVLFYPFAVLAFYYILSHHNVTFWLVLGYIFLAIFSIFLYKSWGIIGLATLIVRRTYFVPAKLNYFYYDFFSNHPFTWWARSKITFRLLDYQYSLDVPHLIGATYFNKPECGANTGWIGSGYAGGGFLGMFFCAVMIGGVLAILNAYGKSIDRRIILPILIPPILSLFMSADIFTAFFTHGMLFVFLLLVFFPRININRTRKAFK